MWEGVRDAGLLRINHGAGLPLFGPGVPPHSGLRVDYTERRSFVGTEQAPSTRERSGHEEERWRDDVYEIGSTTSQLRRNSTGCKSNVRLQREVVSTAVSVNKRVST